ncbi:DUF1566 domain-containing protein [Alteromonas pelagimontana]|uniref:DUF1566 domain-containing protein n=1 Tax=Alteromonas pelagimontana TaxID=1858656 RepID=A0A6M4MEV3_9ALTE|nr:DUF1566 domain-containing protein [Alteromonas pelagimontana]QJR81711.1 DUF1566 domain-containing protein [Alteromonas pelagimontana]
MRYRSASIISFFFTCGRSANRNISQGLVGLVVLLSVSGCGGGGSDSASSSDNIFINAGADRNVTEGATVTLTAEVSGGSESLTYRWSASPALSITQADNAAPTATFTAPAAAQHTEYTLTATVTDTNGRTATDTVVIMVVPDNIAPVAQIVVPTYEDLPVNTFPAGAKITLSGTGSSDADAPDTTDPIAKWAWQQTEGTDVVADVEKNKPRLTFTTPIANTAQTLKFELVVTDAEGATNTAGVALSIQSGSDTKPTVTAGENHAVFSGESIILNGTADSSVPSAFPLQSQWEASGAQSVQIQQPENVLTFAVAPVVSSKTNLTFTLGVTDANGNHVEKEIEVVVRPFPVPLINDTGMITQGTNKDITDTHQNAWPGQDGQRGADVVAKSGFIEKAGRGEASFDFTKLNSNGDEEDGDASNWSCVRDNVTGLVWENKTSDGGIHDAGNSYSWYQSDDNGGYSGALASADAVCTLSQCNAQAYAQAVNAEGLCGFYDWRLPTHFELMSLVHFGIKNGAMIDESYFPFTGDLSDAPLWYWTRQPGADGVQGDVANNAWALDFASGVDNFLNKAEVAHVRLVRAGR